ncbi:hypothetical protein ACH4ZU_13855 [Streptomyces sp. NPDC020472]|uniref:hypothetical protein n=1 Tax=Streptomyces sp. NPDC020472 TaxID=3365075 RepID=UPI00379382CB
MRSLQTNGSSDLTAPIPARRASSRTAAEAVLVEQYPALVRLAHLILPPDLGRHGRVLAAHAVVQRSLTAGGGAGRSRFPGRGAGADPGSGGGVLRFPAPRSGETPGRSAHDRLRAGVVRAALRPPLRVSWGAALPKALGLRIFPPAGGTDELALDRALAAAAPATRAALALTAWEGLAREPVLALLREARAADPERAVAEAERLRAAAAFDVAELLRRPEFDPCTVHLRPTDLLRRRRRTRVAALCGVLALLTGTIGGALVREHETPRPPMSAAPGGTTPVRVPAERWAHTSRVDFTAWPARGDRSSDRPLLRRAVTAWTRGAPLGPGSGARRPSLLFAGTVDGASVVLLHTGLTLVRYTEPGTGRGRPSLVETRADDSDVTTAAAVVLTREDHLTRYLLAPWIAEAGVRDLRAPGAAARPLPVTADGVTGPVADSGPTGGAAPGTTAGSCGEVPALRLRSSTRIVEDHAFLVADLGGLVPAHLTWTPLPTPGDSARRPREATGPLGLAAWSRSACSLAALRDGGVRSVNRWEFAAQPLPEGAGRALWVCARADTWEGRGRADVTLEAAGRSVPVTTVRNTGACGRFGQDVLAGTVWSAPSGARHLLAAGSRRVVGVTAAGAVDAAARGPVLAARAGAAGRVRLTGRLVDGSSLPGWTARTGEGGG